MRNYKVSYHRPRVGREEADQLADFDQLLASAEANTSIGSSFIKYGKSILLFAALAAFVYILLRNNSYEVNYPEPALLEEAPESKESLNLIPQDNEIETTERIEVPEVVIEKQAASPATVPEERKKEAVAVVEEDIKEINTTGFIEAEPVDGFDALYQYFDENLNYPDDIVESGIEGNVIIRFVIDSDGLPSKVSVEKPLHEKIDSVALALINNMPLWKPAMLNGRPLPSTHRIPLFFQIDQVEE